MKKIFIILLSIFFGLSSFAQEEFDDVYYIPSRDITYDTVKVNKDYDLLIDTALNLTVDETNFYSLSDYKRSQIVGNVVLDFRWNSHNYYGSYMWKLKHNMRIGFVSYWDRQLINDIYYWESFYYGHNYWNAFNYNSYYYWYPRNYYQPYYNHRYVYKSNPPVRQRTITHRPERKSTSTYIRQRSDPNSGRVDNRVYSKVLPKESTNTRYVRPERVRSNPKPASKTYRTNTTRSSNYSGQRSVPNTSRSTIKSNHSTVRSGNSRNSSGSSSSSNRGSRSQNSSKRK